MTQEGDIRSYRQLKVWQVGIDIAAATYRLTESFPKREIYGLTSQLQRSAVSIAANVAEGHARDSTKEFLHYISIALGSLAETETHIILAQRLEYINNNQVEELLSQTDELGKMLRGLQKSLKAKARDP